MLLRFDGLDISRWEADVNWETLDVDAEENENDGDGGAIMHVDNEEPVEPTTSHPLVVSEVTSSITRATLSMHGSKRHLLVTHFAHAFNKGLVMWPKSMKNIKRTTFPLLGTGSSIVRRIRQEL